MCFSLVYCSKKQHSYKPQRFSKRRTMCTDNVLLFESSSCVDIMAMQCSDSMCCLFDKVDNNLLTDSLLQCFDKKTTPVRGHLPLVHWQHNSQPATRLQTAFFQQEASK